jgi:transcriptional regulator with XRE-family HTH domain
MIPPKPEESVQGFYAFHLKRHREKEGLSQPALGAQVHISGSLVSGIETCTRRPTLRLSQGLDQVFGLEMFFEGLFPRVMEESGFPAGFAEYAEAEARASMIRLYENSMITGLLQTEAYARTVLKAGQKADKLERLVSARMDRQELLGRDDPPWMVALLDEAAIRRRVGDHDVMKQQLEHLLTIGQEPHVTIHIVPANAPVYPEGAFKILSFPAEPDTGYVESAGGRGRLIESGAHVSELAVIFELIRSVALPVADSEKLIRDLLEAQ